MRDDKRQKRHEVIANAAYALLAKKGYDGTSMLRIATAAKASNETLYRWYGDKRGLFEAMVQDNAADIKAILERAVTADGDPDAALERIAPVFMKMLLGDRAILLNRAAAADPSGELGTAISAGGRAVIQPLIEDLIKGVCEKHNKSGRNLSGQFLGLLIGDLQIKRVIGVQEVLNDVEIEAQSAQALQAFYRIIGVKKP